MVSHAMLVWQYLPETFKFLVISSSISSCNACKDLREDKASHYAQFYSHLKQSHGSIHRNQNIQRQENQHTIKQISGHPKCAMGLYDFNYGFLAFQTNVHFVRGSQPGATVQKISVFGQALFREKGSSAFFPKW